MSDLNLQQALTYCINTGATTAESARKFGVSREALSKLIAEMLNPNGGGEVGDTTEFRNLYGDTKIVHAQLKAGNRTFYLATTGIDSVKGAKMVAFDENGREVDFEALKTKYGISSFNLEANGQITISVSKEPAEEMYIVQEADEKTGFFDTLKDYWEEGKLFFGRLVGSEIVVTQKVERSDIPFETTTPLAYANTIEQDTEIRENTVDLLLNNANNALAMIKHYRDNFGYISSDAIVQGSNVIFDKFIDSITGRNDFVTVFENEDATIEEIKKLEELKTKTKKPEEFAKAFKELYGVDFKPENFLNLTHTAERLNRMNAYAGLSKYFEFGINELKNADTSGFEPAALLAPLFGNNIIKAKEYVDDIRNQCSDENEFRNKLTAKLQEAKQNADKELKGFNRERLENEYRIRYKNAMGNEASDKIIEGYINNSQMCAMLTETGLVIAASLLTMGSSTVVNLTGKAVTKLGAKAGGQAVKAGMTAAMASLPAAETLVSGITSEAGPTEEKINQAWEELKNGLMYGAFGAYVSGPLGNVVSKALSKNPQIFKEIVSSTKFSTSAGTAVETTADVLFDRVTSDLTFKESMAQNGIMNFGMMFVGGRIHNKTQLPDVDMSQIKIEKMKDGTFNLLANDRVFYKTKDENKLAFVTLVLGAKSKTNIEANNPPKNKYTKSSQSTMFEDLQYSKKSIRELVQNAPQLKNNKWIQENIEKLLEECSNANLYSDWNNTIKDAAGKVRTKLEHPLLVQHRLKILNTFLSNPILYENKNLQKEIVYIIRSSQNANNANLITKSLEQYAGLTDRNQTIDSAAPYIIQNTNLSLENKQKIYDMIAKDERNTFRGDHWRYVSNNTCDVIIEMLQYPKMQYAATTLGSSYPSEDVNARINMYQFLKDNIGISAETSQNIANIVMHTRNDNIIVIKELVTNKDYPNELIPNTIIRTNKINMDFVRELISNKDFPKELVPNVIGEVNFANLDFARELVVNKDFPREKIADVLRYSCEENLNFTRKLIADKLVPFEEIPRILRATMNSTNNEKLLYAQELCEKYKKLEIPPDKISLLVEQYGNISPKDLQKLNHVMGRDKVAKLSDSDLLIACQMVDIYGKTSINEIPMEGKQNLLRKLVACNNGLFNVSDDMKKAFPLIPTDREAYCSLLPAIVKSLGVDIRTIEPPSRIKEFNTNLETLSTSVAKLSDNDFTSLDIKLDYPKDDFIKDVLAKVKDLKPKERQKVYDYFGFELHHNKNNPTGFSITGYPINLNNGKKLAEITDPNTKVVVESLRPDVIKFSEQNPIKCNNPEVQKLLNEIVDILPELRTQIGKVQHKTHSYDVFQHSLKVMQKVAQDPKFQTLNESDKKLMMLASLLHDITKGEGYSDKTHAAQGSFDTFFIAKKFNLSHEEEIKLYTLTRHHEWLEYVNTAKSEEQLTKRLQSVAYDLQHDNLFDMALMFTHADLKAVKADDSFHDTKIGRSRVDFSGKTRSFGESADVYAKRIKEYIGELQKSQPFLPVTQIPKTDRINSAITKVNPDGSTNIKGVYKRSDGLVVIKFNEVEDWEAIGFPKGSVSRGYTAKGGSTSHGQTFTEDVNTGNIKFFAHGLDYENQLAKFDAFSLIDSDVLLSVSYAERPESKYRFFRSQGVLLDFDTKYIHGGGETDSGSGYGKSIEEFKKNYIFGGERESDRLYVSNLIKKATGMNDSEYVKFVEANKNKPLTEIEPAEYREPLIKAYASINSNTRRGDRAYNEMYGSNPKEVMAVFAYDENAASAVGNPLDFLTGRANQRTEFLQRYALERNIPFIVFGD